jgi:hypothetical protein
MMDADKRRGENQKFGSFLQRSSFRCWFLKVLVGSVAKGRRLGVLALAQISGLGFRRGKNQGAKAMLLMGPVAKGLLFRMAAGAPGVGFS